jgi:hypothetical protein
MEPVIKEKTPRVDYYYGILVVIVFLLAGAVIFTFSKTKPAAQPQPYLSGELNLQDVRRSLLDAYRSGNFDLAENLPNPGIVPIETNEDALSAFYASRFSAHTRLRDKQIGYLLRIVDSNEPTTDELRGIAAYFLLHVFYDYNRDLGVLKDVIARSSYLNSLTPRARAVFPESLGIFTTPPDEMAFFKQRLYFAAYLTALSEARPLDTFSASANAAREIFFAYNESLLNPANRLQNQTPEGMSAEGLETMYLDVLNDLLARSLGYLRTDFFIPPDGDSFTSLFPYDAVVGLNHLAFMIRRVREVEAEQKFPTLRDVEPAVLFATSLNLAKRNELSLASFTAYNYALYLSLHSPQTAANDAKIEELVRFIVGDPPFEARIKTAAQRFIGVKELPPDAMRGFNEVSAIARRSPLLRDFLKQKDGWTEADFR